MYVGPSKKFTIIIMMIILIIIVHNLNSAFILSIINFDCGFTLLIL